MNWRLRHLPLLLAVSAVLAVVAAVVGWWTRGGVGAVGAAVGVAIATASFALSTLVIAWADSVEPRLIMPFGMAAYITKISVIGGVLLIVANTGLAGLVPLSWGIVVGVVGWTAAQIWWVTTGRASRASASQP